MRKIIKWFIPAVLFVMLCIPAYAAGTGSITVTMKAVTGESVNGGELSLYNEYALVATEQVKDGSVLFSGLEEGEYLVRQTAESEEYEPINEFVVSIPLEVGGEILYDVEAMPKTEKRSENDTEKGNSEDTGNSADAGNSGGSGGASSGGTGEGSAGASGDSGNISGGASGGTSGGTGEGSAGASGGSGGASSGGTGEGSSVSSVQPYKTGDIGFAWILAAAVCVFVLIRKRRAL